MRLHFIDFCLLAWLSLVVEARECLSTPAQILGTIFYEGDGSPIILHSERTRKVVTAGASDADSDTLMHQIPANPCDDSSSEFRIRSSLKQKRKLILSLSCTASEPPDAMYERLSLDKKMVEIHRAVHCDPFARAASADSPGRELAVSSRRRRLLDADSTTLVGAAGGAFVLLGGGLAALQVKYLSKPNKQERSPGTPTVDELDAREVDLYHFASRAEETPHVV